MPICSIVRKQRHLLLTPLPLEDNLTARTSPTTNLLRSTLLKNTLWMTIGQGLRFIVQAMYFTVIARSLGATNYGAFIGASALVGIIYPFGALGGGTLLVRDVSRDRKCFNQALGTALTLIFVFGPVLVGLALFGSSYILPREIPRTLVLVVALSDIIGLNLILLSSQAFQAFERLEWSAGIYLMISIFRLAAAVVTISIVPHPSPLEWGYAYLGSTGLTAVLCYLAVRLELGIPTRPRSRNWHDIKEGFYFSLSLSAITIYNDIDKAMLARLSTLAATGVYGAAYRLIEIAFAPILAFLSASYPQLFRVGRNGASATLAYTESLLLRAIPFSLCIFLCTLLLSGLVPFILGRQYIETAEALRWLAIIPVLRTAHTLLSNALTAVGYQGTRSMIQLGVAVFNALINLWIIPAYSWRGAAVSSVVTDALLVVVIGCAVRILLRRSRTDLLASSSRMSL
jgi:O-antigen/teichoic acid export membrane protein